MFLTYRHTFVCPFVRLLANCEHDIMKNKWTDFDENWHKWSAGQGHEMINFGGQEIKGQGHTRERE